MAEADEWEAVAQALRDVGIDPTDLGRFVNYPNPDLPGVEPSRFDAKRAYPVLLEWLPRVHADSLKSTIATRLIAGGKRSETARALLDEYRVATNDTLRWALADAIARSSPPRNLEEIVELSVDRSGGTGRQMLVYALWRVKTERARDVILELIDDPDVCVHAMYSLRRAFGNEEARRRLEPLLEHPNERVRDVAGHTLKKIDKVLAR